MLDFVIFAITFVAALIIAVVYLYPGSKKVTTIPGMEPSDPKEGNSPDIRDAGSFHEFLLELHEAYGDIASFWKGERLIVSIASPELFKEHEKVFDRPVELYASLEPLIGPDSIQFANGADGRCRRSTYDASFGHQMVSSFFPTFQKSTLGLVTKWKAMTTDDHVPLMAHMNALALKIITLTSFGEYFEDEKKILEFRRNFDVCWHETEKSMMDDFSKPGSDRQKKFEKHKKEMYDKIEHIIELRKKSPPDSEDKKVFIDVLLENNLPEAQLISDAVTYIIGGFETTGNLMTWVVYFLASHPKIQEKLHGEIETTLGRSGKLTPEILPSLVYLRQVLDETLRCSVLAPSAARVQDFDSELGGHVIPKNTPVIQALGVVLQDDRLWPMPNKFNPDRFSPENFKELPKHAAEFFGFAGKRKCPGYRFAYAEVSAVLVVLLQNFKVDLVEGQVVVPQFGFVCHPQEEVWIKVSDRQKTKTR